jgi:hypothetical protein
MEGHTLDDIAEERRELQNDLDDVHQTVIPQQEAGLSMVPMHVLEKYL